MCSSKLFYDSIDEIKYKQYHLWRKKFNLLSILQTLIYSMQAGNNYLKFLYENYDIGITEINRI